MTFFVAGLRYIYRYRIWDIYLIEVEWIIYWCQIMKLKVLTLSTSNNNSTYHKKVNKRDDLLFIVIKVINHG